MAVDKILIIDDDPGFRKIAGTILSGDGYASDSGVSVADAARLGRGKQYHLVMTAVKLPDGDGFDVLRWFGENSPETPVVMISSNGTMGAALEAMKSGAADYLEKPLFSPEDLRLLVRRTIDARAVERERHVLRERESERFAGDNLIARDPRMVEILDLVRKIAPSNAAVLLNGPGGSGKEVLARAIHRHSPRADRVFISVNCNGKSPANLERELFGHEKENLAGVEGLHPGSIEWVRGGTLFLDEIGALDMNVQSKLLRVLQERVFERVGGTRQIGADIRLIAATRRDVGRMVAEGELREDLYYRLNTFPLVIPPLKDRPADIPELARFFLARAAARLGKAGLTLTPDALDALVDYSWPGNVRELENAVERAAILCDRPVTAEDLPLPRDGGPGPTSWNEIERKAIQQALRMNHGNRTHAARQLGISLRKLQYRLKEYEAAE